ncbi:UDP-N-acetylmuramate--L-alanine ligase [Pedobacter glucosidilyticus]|nr:UDP-N-acetylmuramate--L-alanine ligase [Pedobacter glucosidilyticus]
MIKLEDIQRVYLIGIGGIGMSGLARYFHKRGCVVCGYDKTATPLTLSLADEGIPVRYEDLEENIPMNFHELSSSTLIIYTPAIPQDSVVLNFFKRKGFTLYKRSQVLGILSAGMYTIAVAGTHGKTTTSTLITHLLLNGGNDCSAFLGGISSNYDTNIIIGKNNVMVVEADEYDRSFLTLHPDVAVVTSMDADHLDIYGDESHLIDSFKLFAGQVKTDGKLFVRKGLPLAGTSTYGLTTQADAYAQNIRVEAGEFKFDFKNQELEMPNLVLGLAGQHNIENAVAAIQVALLMGISIEDIRAGLASFKGVKRRFEYIIKQPKRIYIDDYAHHPEELRACFKAVRTLYPDKKLTVVFQPHLFTRTRDFADGFAEVLATADELLLLDIYPARELPIPGVDSDFLAQKINSDKVIRCSKEQALQLVRSLNPELLVTVGAGDIDTLVKPLHTLFTNA